jgi:hypothetical protein
MTPFCAMATIREINGGGPALIAADYYRGGM